MTTGRKLPWPLLAASVFLVVACGKKGAESGAAPPATAAAAQDEAPIARVDSQRIIDSAKEPGVWLSTGRTYDEQRFSPLDKINTQNVAKLGLAWTYKVDVDRGAEATPLVVDGVMYTTGAYSILYALDAKTGALRWKYDPEVPRSKAGNACCDVVNRGVAISGGKVFLGAFDGRVIALDARDGKKLWEVDAKDGSGRTFTLTGAPIVVNKLVIVGSGGAEYNARGYVSAFDTQTGQLAWRFYTVPGDPAKGPESDALEMARKTWTGKKYVEHGGGGTVWNSIAYDPDAGLIYFGTGNAIPWNKIARDEPSADNLFTSSIVALKADTGAYAWHYQEVPGDNWDYDAASSVILADLTIGEKPRKVLLHAPKNGFFYVLDRLTGELISAEKFAPANWATHVDMKTGRPVVDEKVADWHHEPKVVTPGALGAHNWQPMSFSPKTGLVYIPAQIGGALMSPNQDPKIEAHEGWWNVGGTLPLPESPKEIAAIVSTLEGQLLAWDPVKQKAAWVQKYPTNVWNGGTLATGGNLVFQGTADGRFVAYSADKGEKLWETPANSGVMAGAMTYEIDGEQYVSVMAGWGGVYPLFAGALANAAKVRPEARVLTYKIGGSATLPAAKHEPVPLPELQAIEADDKTLARGGQVFHDRCAWCHGINAVGGGIIPDLRYLGADKHEMFAAIVAGAKADRGMPSFAGKIAPEDVEATRQYVIKRSHDLRKDLAAAGSPKS